MNSAHSMHLGLAFVVMLFAGAWMAGCSTPATVPAPTLPPTMPAADPSKGRALFHGEVEVTDFVACQTCHTTDPTLGDLVGPNLSGVRDRAPNRVPGIPAEEYLRRSIASHDEFVVEGFVPGMVSGVVGAEFGELLSSEQIDELVAYLLTLEGPASGSERALYRIIPEQRRTPTRTPTRRPATPTRIPPTFTPAPPTPIPTNDPTAMADPSLKVYNNCIDCHALHPASVVRIPHANHPQCSACHSGSPSRVGCPTCHSMHMVKAPHEYDPQPDCRTCHTDYTPTPVP